MSKQRAKLLYENNLVTFLKGLYTDLGTSPVLFLLVFFFFPLACLNYFSIICAFFLFSDGESSRDALKPEVLSCEGKGDEGEGVCIYL